MTDPSAGGDVPADDAACWRAAARLRGDHPGWVVLWLSSIRQFRAYRLSQRARTPVTLTASDPAVLDAQITAAEQDGPEPTGDTS
ncbi:MAG TPA: hypothetical protein VMR00_20570 [Streptosporangiaceae bacterium]|jgi:hypothetical protein|nr:hypothetical protein [Streptosporangiaceae bacterium]